MIKHISYKNMGGSDLGWLKSLFHFSFADYYNPQNINFGDLRVVNDDLVAAGTGFDTHPHKDMEIVSYVIAGELTHGDSMGNKSTLKRGDVQYMTAGTGVFHSEHNLGKDTARFLQIWIFPNAKNIKPNYGDYRFNVKDRVNNLQHLASNASGDAPIKIHQDVNIYATIIDSKHPLDFDISKNRQAYIILVEGEANMSNIYMEAKDALEVTEESIKMVTATSAHFLIIEMKKK